MTLNKYQEKAMSTCMDSCENISYMLLNLVAEVGEFSGKLAKAIRKKQIAIGGKTSINRNQLTVIDETFDALAFDEELLKEAGDILWQFAGLCKVMGWELEYVGVGNLVKLADRKERDVIDGSGDNR